MSVETDLGFLTPLALSGDGSILAIGSNPLVKTENAIRLWDTRNKKLLGVCKGHSQGVRWVAFSPDAQTLASVSDDSTLRFWNVRTQQELLSIRRQANPSEKSFSLRTVTGSQLKQRAACACWMPHEIAMQRRSWFRVLAEERQKRLPVSHLGCLGEDLTNAWHRRPAGGMFLA